MYRNFNYLQKNYLECIKTGRNDSKFNIGKYHIKTMQIIKLFQVNIFMPVTRFPRLTICLFCKSRPFLIFGQFRGLFKETNNKDVEFCVEKEREKKAWMTKVVKSCHQITWAQKSTAKKRERIFNFKIFTYE